MDVNRILENYVIRQVFVLVGVIFLVFGGIFLAAPVRRFTELCFFGERDGLFLGDKKNRRLLKSGGLFGE